MEGRKGGNARRGRCEGKNEEERQSKNKRRKRIEEKSVVQRRGSDCGKGVELKDQSRKQREST